MVVDDQDRKRAEGARPEPAPAERRSMFTALIVGGLMLLEGAGIFAAVKLVGGQPQPIEAAVRTELLDEHGNLQPPNTELRVTEVMAFNSKTGRVFIYHLTVFAEVDTQHAARLERVLQHRRNTVEDRFSQVIRGCDPKYLDEPGLETVRRQFKAALEQVLGAQVPIKEILIPQFSKSRAD
jgi:flagellar basal body-associated protein FliL